MCKEVFVKGKCAVQEFVCKVQPCVNSKEYGDGMCQYHYRDANRNKVKAKEVTPIPKQSEKEKKRMKEYMPIRNKHLKEWPVCQMRFEDGPCTVKATQCHHVAGRIGDLLTDPDNLLSCCDNCHRIAETQPERAKKAGVSKSRLKKAV